MDYKKLKLLAQLATSALALNTLSVPVLAMENLDENVPTQNKLREVLAGLTPEKQKELLDIINAGVLVYLWKYSDYASPLPSRFYEDLKSSVIIKNYNHQDVGEDLRAWENNYRGNRYITSDSYDSLANRVKGYFEILFAEGPDLGLLSDVNDMLISCRYEANAGHNVVTYLRNYVRPPEPPAGPDFDDLINDDANHLIRQTPLVGYNVSQSIGPVTSKGRNECVICLREFEPISDILTTSCGHSYHYNCLSDWAKTKRHDENSTFQCPICRQELSLSNNDPSNELKRSTKIVTTG